MAISALQRLYPSLPLLLLSLLALQPVLLIAKGPKSEIVPYVRFKWRCLTDSQKIQERWNCGASDFDKSLSHQLSKEDCPKRMCKSL